MITFKYLRTIERRNAVHFIQYSHKKYFIKYKFFYDKFLAFKLSFLFDIIIENIFSHKIIEKRIYYYVCTYRFLIRNFCIV